MDEGITMGTPSTTYSWWQYSQWVRNVARNARITNPTGAELAAFKTFIKTFWNPQTDTGTRPWLAQKFMRLSATATASHYEGDIDNEPTPVLVRMVEVIGRDLKKIPMTDAEGIVVIGLLVSTGVRALGSGPYFGGVIGSATTVTP